MVFYSIFSPKLEHSVHEPERVMEAKQTFMRNFTLGMLLLLTTAWNSFSQTAGASTVSSIESKASQIAKAFGARVIATILKNIVGADVTF